MHATASLPHDGHSGTPPTSSPGNTAVEVLRLVMRHRRAVPPWETKEHGRCDSCLAPHIDRVVDAVGRAEPIVFVLPAFPGKSPNPSKVLGARPDMAERQSLAFLDTLCRRIGEIHRPGARMVVCSDGRVFSDAVGIPEDDITTYQQGLNDIIAEIGAEKLTTFNLDDVYDDCGFDAMRSRLMREHGETIENLRAEVRTADEALRLYRGITRFLLEDAMRPNLAMSKTALQKECKRRAYVVIQRSRAWDRLLAKRFPNAVRLSIHPQMCGSRKIGIHLMQTADEWLTPWHGVAVEMQGRFRLMKRSQAEKLGAELVYRDGFPSHYIARAAWAPLTEERAR